MTGWINYTHNATFADGLLNRVSSLQTPHQKRTLFLFSLFPLHMATPATSILFSESFLNQHPDIEKNAFLT
jgi:hypothetical protein